LGFGEEEDAEAERVGIVAEKGKGFEVSELFRGIAGRSGDIGSY